MTVWKFMHAWIYTNFLFLWLQYVAIHIYIGAYGGKKRAISCLYTMHVAVSWYCVSIDPGHTQPDVEIAAKEAKTFLR